MDESYNEWLEKFAPKKTTDDCYTPEAVYEAVAAWAVREYGLEQANIVRPFWPGEDYESRDYGPDDVVIDNPPFSILSKIMTHFNERGVRYFLFAQGVTVLSTAYGRGTAIAAGVKIQYSNGAEVNTGFVTNMEPGIVIRSAPELYKIVKAANDAEKKEKTRKIPKYSYSDEVLTAAMVNRYSMYGVELAVREEDCEKVGKLDSQKAAGKSIYGSGLLLSKRAAAERAAAERAAAERAAAERAAAERAGAICWELSAREREICDALGKKEDGRNGIK